MKTLVLDGPMAQKTWQRSGGRGPAQFVKGVPQDVDDDEFAAELLAASVVKEGDVVRTVTLEEAAVHCIPVFREVIKGKGVGGEVKSDV